MTTDSVVDAASIRKQFVAAAILMLVEEKDKLMRKLGRKQLVRSIAAAALKPPPAPKPRNPLSEISKLVRAEDFDAAQVLINAVQGGREKDVAFLKVA